MTVDTDRPCPVVEHAQHSELPGDTEDFAGEVMFPCEAEAIPVPAKAKAAERIDVDARISNL